MFNDLSGIGLRDAHIIPFYQSQPQIGWLEVHSENYITQGSIDYKYLLNIRKNYNISLHGIGMSLGSFERPDIQQIKSVKSLIKEIDPILVSEHLSWSSSSDKYLPELLPIPYNKESMDIFTRNIQIAQDILQRTILIENPSSYFEYTNSSYEEPEFLNIISKKTGAGILLDVNNIYVSGMNNDWCPEEYINRINKDYVKEMHVAGHSKKKITDNTFLLIDSHDQAVSDPVWHLFEVAIKKFGLTHSLIEWDSDLPTLEDLLLEAKKIDYHMQKVSS